MNESKPNTEDQKKDSHDKVFEFTSDLNIAAVKNNQEPAPTLPSTPLSFQKESPKTPVNNTNTEGITNPVKPIPKPSQKETVIRTYESDVAEAMAKNNISVADIAVAANKKHFEESRPKELNVQKPIPPKPIPPTPTPIPKTDSAGTKIIETMPTTPQEIQKTTEKTEEKPPQENKPQKSKWPIISLIIIIAIAGLAIGYYLYLASPLYQSKQPIQNSAPTNDTVENYNPYIAADHKTVTIVGESDQIKAFQAIMSVIARNNESGHTEDIVFAKETTTEEGVPSQKFLTLKEAVNLFDLNVPDELTRTLYDRWQLGTITTTKGDNGVFLILSTNYFQNAFSALLSLEKDIAKDISKYNNSSPEETQNEASSTSITNLSAMSFTDVIISNKDVRELKDADGSIVFLYSFVDNEKLVIAASEEVFLQVVSRLEKASYSR